ncbi:lysozyme S-like, partial [Zootermopsis nevadensis]
MLTKLESRYNLLLLFMVIYWSPEGGYCKVYERCELARELKEIHNISEEQIPTWVCIAQHESDFNTSAVGHVNGDGSGDHGLFQISDLYWCSPPGRGWVCGVSCADLEDDDIKDDVACARTIYRQHQRLNGDGFTAWAVYQPYCYGKVTVAKYVEGCEKMTTKTTAVEEPLVKNEVAKISKSEFKVE